MDRTIKALRNEINNKEERSLQRSLDRKANVETKKKLSSANNKITMIEQMLDNAKKNCLAQRKEIESLKKRSSNDRVEARNKNHALRETCDSLKMQLKRSEGVIMEKISLLEDLERKMYFSNMNTNTLNSQIDALSLQLNCVEEDYFNVLDEFLEKSIDMQRNLYQNSILETKQYDQFVTEIALKIQELDGDSNLEQKTTKLENLYLMQKNEELSTKTKALLAQLNINHSSVVELRKMYLKNNIEERQKMSQSLDASVRSLGEKHFKEMSRLAVNTKIQRLHYEDDIKQLNRCVKYIPRI